MRPPRLWIFLLVLMAAPLAAAEPSVDGDERQRRAMLEAGETGDAAAIYRLVSAGAKVDVTDEAQRTPLFMAVTANRLDAVKQLLAEGANVNARANDRATPWLLAAGLGRTQMLRLMIPHKPDLTLLDRFGDTALSAACEAGFPDTVQVLLTLPVDVNHRNALGWTCLIEMAFVSDGGPAQQAIAAAVLKAGADPNIADAHGKTALAHAEARKLAALAAILKAHGGK